MVGAIDAVCDVAQRIIGKLKEGTSGEGPPLLGPAVNHNAGGRPPTPAMKRFADSVARQKGIKPPAGYTKSGSICRTFLDRHAPKKVGDESSGETGSKPPSQAQILSNLGTERHKGRRKAADASKPPGSMPPKSTGPKRRPRNHTADTGSGPATHARQSTRPGRVARNSDSGFRD